MGITQVDIDKFCAQMLKEYGPENIKVIRFIIGCRPSKEFWKSNFNPMYEQINLWGGPSSCPPEIALNNGVGSKILHRVCHVHWKDIEQLDHYAWDFKDIFECVQANPSSYSHLVPFMTEIIEKMTGADGIKIENLIPLLAKTHVQLTPESVTFLLGLSYQSSSDADVKKMGINMLKSVPKYSRYMSLPADEWRANMPYDEIKKCRVNMAFITDAQHEIGRLSENAREVLIYNWAEQMKYSREFLTWLFEHFPQNIRKEIINHINGSDLDLIKKNATALSKLECHPLYVFLSIRKMGDPNKAFMKIFYERFLWPTNVKWGMTPSMIFAIAND